MWNFVVLLTSLLTASLAHAGEYKTVSVAHVASLLVRKDVIVIDVRTPEEHARGRLAQKEKIIDYFHTQDLDGALFALDQRWTYVVYCHDGRRGKRAAQIMAGFGLDVYHLDGGIKAYYQKFPRRVFEFREPPKSPPEDKKS